MFEEYVETNWPIVQHVFDSSHEVPPKSRWFSQLIFCLISVLLVTNLLKAMILILPSWHVMTSSKCTYFESCIRTPALTYAVWICFPSKLAFLYSLDTSLVFVSSYFTLTIESCCESFYSLIDFVLIIHVQSSKSLRMASVPSFTFSEHIEPSIIN